MPPKLEKHAAFDEKSITARSLYRKRGSKLATAFLASLMHVESFLVFPPPLIWKTACIFPERTFMPEILRALINFEKGYLCYEGNSYDRFIGIFLNSLWNIHDDR
ncbi:MAG: hypothetical protein JSS06_04995 [Proteobacteria bacterium]|nr:hypothetical protein [Pseudomonadota bacterium]